MPRFHCNQTILDIRVESQSNGYVDLELQGSLNDHPHVPKVVEHVLDLARRTGTDQAGMVDEMPNKLFLARAGEPDTVFIFNYFDPLKPSSIKLHIGRRYECTSFNLYSAILPCPTLKTRHR